MAFNGKSFGDLSLMKTGLNGLDLRKPISVEKKHSPGTDNGPNTSTTDVIQHTQERTEEPELIRDKNVKIIKQTKNEVLASVAAEQDLKARDPDSDGSDDSFDRMSNDDLNNELTSESPPQKLEDSQLIDTNGVKWTTVHANDESTWTPFKKFERWIVFDGMRHHQESQAKEQQSHGLQQQSNKVVVSSRLNHVMERILGNLMKMKKHRF